MIKWIYIVKMISAMGITPDGMGLEKLEVPEIMHVNSYVERDVAFNTYNRGVFYIDSLQHAKGWYSTPFYMVLDSVMVQSDYTQYRGVFIPSGALPLQNQISIKPKHK